MVYPQVRLVDVAVVGLELLLPDGYGDSALLVEAPCLPVDLPSGAEDLGLAHDLEGQRPLYVLQAGDVLDLASLLPDGDVAVAADAPLAVSRKVDDVADVLYQLLEELPRLCGAGEIGFGDDLRQGYARAVVVHERRQVADPLRLPRILFHMDPGYPDGLLAVEIVDAAFSDRVVVLRYLDALGHVRVEVGLPGEPGGVVDPASEHLREHDPVLQDLPVQDGPRSRHAQACGADMGIGSLGLGGGAAAEHLAPGRELDVYLQSDLHSAGLLSSNAFSQSSAMENRTSSSHWFATNCIPIGMPSPSYPQGTFMWGIPARLGGTVR